jgi:hypothetical protein
MQNRRESDRRLLPQEHSREKLYSGTINYWWPVFSLGSQQERRACEVLQ